MRRTLTMTLTAALCGATLWQAAGLADTDKTKASHAADGDRGRSTTVGEPFRWSAKVNSGSRLAVEVVNGSIDAEPAQSATAEVEAEYRVHGTKPHGPLPEIHVRQSTDKVRIYVDYPEDYPEDKQTPSVHFRVRVPEGVVFAATTVNGAIRAERLNGPIQAETVNGSIRAETTARAPEASIQLETVNGAIELRLPLDVNADLSISTVNGAFDSDLPISLNGRMNSGNLEGRLGKGGPRITLSSVNGSIRVLAPDA